MSCENHVNENYFSNEKYTFFTIRMTFYKCCTWRPSSNGYKRL